MADKQLLLMLKKNPAVRNFLFSLYDSKTRASFISEKDYKYGRNIIEILQDEGLVQYQAGVHVKYCRLMQKGIELLDDLVFECGHGCRVPPRVSAGDLRTQTA